LPRRKVGKGAEPSQFLSTGFAFRSGMRKEKKIPNSLGGSWGWWRVLEAPSSRARERESEDKEAARARC